MPPIHKGNKLGLCTGKGAEQDEEGKPVCPPKPREEKNKEKLVRVGSKLYGRSTHTERKFNIGFRVEKAPGGVSFCNQNELIVDKQREYKLLEGRLPTYPGEQPLPKPEDVSLPSPNAEGL